ncbi:1-deoxy-D-xylulose 5-phosphate reductoisomerase [Pseudomonas agarici]|uniref:1-deoxy-D-xylulose 5-phosphate reductoisomerase n=1 Tax=Pseudomonas agarici TaxID=46677 RepID=A0A0X1SYL7_PSEAA|nr:1-deoxy-D-xylulose-5-phosphate reductoisomerase [Pseudomonas agarici]AMB84917.1 1-deoxy-D-xylulose 5-phosphate reductoisomerase [Pseudomonas agarici]
MHQRLTLLGATGSIGDSTLDLVARHPEHFSVFALTAHRNIDKLYRQCLSFKPAVAVVAGAEGALQLSTRLKASGYNTEVLHGPQALMAVAVANECDTVVAAIVGAAGLASTLAAANAGKRILLANKEALVMSGALLMGRVAATSARLLPVDSEHNAIFQCLSTHPGVCPERLILTASGGPFLTRPLDTLGSVTPDQACAHPKWRMGRKISVDCATMMNKGLEVIEAHWLFDMPAERIEVLIHPQSIVHSMVVYADQSVLAQLGNPDMRTPIAQALAHPRRIDSGVEPLDLTRCEPLAFSKPDLLRFPCLHLALEVARGGCELSVVLNAANEVAVAAFLAGALAFSDITRVVSQTLEQTASVAIDSLEAIEETDRRARARALQLSDLPPAR